MKLKSAASLALLSLFAAAASAQALEAAAPSPDESVVFGEIWAYLMAGDEKSLDPHRPISDIACFSASINSKGELAGVPSIAALAASPARKHLVIAELSNSALLHFVLSPEYPVRERLLAQIAEAGRAFDGVQIDFEAVLSYDSADFLSFLGRLKELIAPRILSVALPARWKPVGDAYDYSAIAKVVDRVVVMAYDEHWSGSAPGSIASMQWCERVASYALSTVGGQKLAMGMPFYGRAWGDHSYAKAYLYSGALKLIDERALQPERDKEGIPFVTFSETVNYTFYFEDRESLLLRARLYRSLGVSRAAFWRLGQEDVRVWEALGLGPAEPPPPAPPGGRGPKAAPPL